MYFSFSFPLFLTNKNETTRVLPNVIPTEPPKNVQTHSGLELKICLNTYKIFFVENTEDFFKRTNANPSPSQARRGRNHRIKCFERWHNGENGWKKSLSPLEQTQYQKQFKEWFEKNNFHVFEETREDLPLKFWRKNETEMETD